MELFNLPDDPNVKYINDRLKLVYNNDEVLVYYENKLTDRYHKDDTEYRKFAIIRLAKIGAANFMQLCKGFDISAKTLEKYINISRNKWKNIYNEKTGPREPWKVDHGLRLAIIKLFVNNENISDREIARRIEEELNISINHKTVAQVLQKAGLNSKDNDNSDKNKTNKTNKKDNGTIDLFDNENNNIDSDSSSADEEKNQHFEQKLQQGIETMYGANLIFPTIENNEKLYEAFEKVYGNIEIDPNFSNKMFLDSLVHQCLLDEYTKDSFDHLENEDFGVLLHHHRGPNSNEISDFLAHVASQNKAEEFAHTLSSLTIKPEYQFIDNNGNSVCYRVILIDGHFDPYYYKLNTFKGFHSVRRLVMKGDVSYSICDDKGLPIVCTRKTANPKLNKIIPNLLSDFREMLDDDDTKLLVEFDREGFDKELFWEIDQLKNTYFITWDKNDKAVSQIPDEKFTLPIYKRLTGNNRINIKYFPTVKKIIYDKDDHNITEKRTLHLRKFCIQDQGSKKKSSLLSNAPAELFQDDSIITFLLIRQRQENFHKAFLNNKGWDHYTTHLTENKRRKAIVKGVLVPNPAIKAINEQKTKITKELNKLLNQFAKDSLSDKIPEDMPKKKIQEKYINILTEIEILKNKKKALLDEDKKLPGHLPVEEAYPDKNFYQRDFEEKSFLEAVKIFAYNKEQTAAFEAAEFCRFKDRFLFLNMLKRRICKVCCTGNQLLVKIKDFSKPKFQRVAEKLFGKINGRHMKFSTDNDYVVNFELYSD